MKLLFDQNLSPNLVQQISDLFPGSSHVYLLGLDRADDRLIFQWAKENEFVIVTKDADYSDLFNVRISAKGNLDHAGKLLHHCNRKYTARAYYRHRNFI